MRLLFFILLVLLIAHIGFWHALGAILGAVAMLFLFSFLLIPLLIVGGFLMVAASLR
jgi:hypothetical protein